MFAVGVKHQYHGMKAKVDASGSKKIALAVHDQRPIIVAGDKPAHFTGITRGGFGNPFNVVTKSGNKVSDDFAATLGKSLESKGFGLKLVSTTHLLSREEVVSELKKQPNDLSILLTINEWRSDTFAKSTVIYNNLVIEVLDKEGTVLTAKRLQGEEKLAGSMWNPPKYARKHVPLEYIKRLEQLVNHVDIVNLLQG